MHRRSIGAMESWASPHGRPLPIPGQRTLIMGVLNVTPDSFSDGGQLAHPEAVVVRAKGMVAAGADVLDLGGESTRPGAAAVSAAEELARVLPALTAIRRALPEVPISIDTYKAAVAEACISAGADIINDIWGLTHGLTSEQRTIWRERARTRTLPSDQSLATTEMARVAARLNAPVILMHNRPDRAYQDFWEDVLLDLQMSVSLAAAAEIERRQLWLDPGFGFAKNPAQNLAALRDLHRMVELGLPVLVGTSRKSTLGLALGGAPVEERREATAATVVWAIQQGCAMVRVHDVPEVARFVRVADAIKAGLRFSPP